MKRYIFVLLLISTTANAARDGFCSFIFNNTSIFLPVHSLKEPFLSMARQTTNEDRWAVLKRFRGSYDSKTAGRMQKIVYHIERDIKDMKDPKVDIVTLEGEDNIMHFLKLIGYKFQSPDPFATIKVTGVAFIFWIALNAILHSLDTSVPTEEELLTFVAITGVISWHWVQIQQNRSHISEFQSMDQLLQVLNSKRFFPEGAKIYIARSFGIDRVDLLLTRRRGTLHLDIVHWRVF